jgi:hypothetical protein
VTQLRFGRIALVAAFALFGACRPQGTSGTAGWRAWFDSTFQQLPKAASPEAAPVNWVNVRGPDGLRARLDPDYKKRNDYGCWSKRQDQWPGPGWRDICVHSLDPTRSPPGLKLKPRRLDPNMVDQHEFTDWRTEALTWGSRRAIVERARATGGIEGAKRERMIAMVIELRPGEWATLEGRTGDDRGYEELIRIASTIDPPLS